MVRPRVREDWRKLVEQFRARGGVTVAAFARQTGVEVETFRRWVREVERAESGPPKTQALTFIEVEVPQVVEPQPVAAVELQVGRDVVVRMDRLPPASWLAELARAC